MLIILNFLMRGGTAAEESAAMAAVKEEPAGEVGEGEARWGVQGTAGRSLGRLQRGRSTHCAGRRGIDRAGEVFGGMCSSGGGNHGLANFPTILSLG